MKILANTCSPGDRRGGQDLIQHLQLVGLAAMGLAKRCGLPEQFQISALAAGLCHDVGKGSDDFQSWVQEKSGLTPSFPREAAEDLYQDSDSKGEFPFHHEVSWLWFLMIRKVYLNSNLTPLGWSFAENSIFYHHAHSVYKYDSEFPTLTRVHRDVLKRLGSGSTETLKKVNEIAQRAIKPFCDVLGWQNDADFDPLELLDSLDSRCSIPEYFLDSHHAITEKIKRNSALSLVRTAVIIADRRVSGLETDKFEKFASQYLSDQDSLGTNVAVELSLELYPELKKHDMADAATFREAQLRNARGTRFEDITQRQLDLAEKASEKLATVVATGAGSGKTRIGLNFASLCLKKNPHQRVYWVVPRNSIAVALGKQIPDELKAIYGGPVTTKTVKTPIEGSNPLKHHISVEVYLTGERKKGLGCNSTGKKELGCDIVITNIDSILNPYAKHNLVDRTFDFSRSVVIFDEAHEFVTPEPMFFHFMAFVAGRRLFTKSQTLLLTATPLPFEQFWDFDDVGEKTQVLDYKDLPHWNMTPVSIELTEDLEVLEKNEGFTVFNSVYRTLEHFLKYKDNVLAHSSFTDTESDAMLNELLQKLGKESWSRETQPTAKLSASLIVQSALDISTNNMTESLLSPMKTMQVLGRCNRFATSDNPTMTIVNALGDKREQAVVSTLFQGDLAKAWWAHLQKNIVSGTAYSRDALSEVYETFFLEYKSEVNKWLVKNLSSSLEKSEHIVPKRFPFLSKPVSKEKLKVSSGNMRDSKGSYLVSAPVLGFRQGKLCKIEKDNLLRGDDLMTCDSREAADIAANMAANENVKILKRFNKQGYLYPNFRTNQSAKEVSDMLLRAAKKTLSPLLYLPKLKTATKDNPRLGAQKIYVRGLGFVKRKDLEELGIVLGEEL